mmetsp:Transcript_10623/g.25569  ORF Transcript_10623/g.25569 Transcript_10623/m.25569 type:complete len:164 (-) Transcript_10623:70-561(-)
MTSVTQVMESRDETIRSRLLHSLGIHKTIPNSARFRAKYNSSHQDVKLLSDDAPIRRSLNDKNEYRGNGRRPITTKKRLVRFNSIVTEKQIASHKKYSDRMKRELWNDPNVIEENAYRNQIEFEAEGMDWQSVLENEEMYLDTKTGELIHPFWVEGDDSEQLS